MPTLTTQALQIVAVAGVALGLAGLVVALLALSRLGRLRRVTAVLQGDGEHRPLVDTVGSQIEAVEVLRREVEGLSAHVGATREELSSTLRHVAVVRYDAFPDMGGRMSFSAALLDDTGEGVVITSINGRSDGRTYAKGVRDGASDHPLSPEEYEAIAVARGAVRPARRARSEGDRDSGRLRTSPGVEAAATLADPVPAAPRADR